MICNCEIQEECEIPTYLSENKNTTTSICNICIKCISSDRNQNPDCSKCQRITEGNENGKNSS